MTDKVAYTTGTFDLVHEGHFEFFKAMSQYCNKIIVGLVTDEFAEQRKRKPYLTYRHRKAILENSKYNIVVVPCTVSNKQLDYNKLRFDALFIEDGYYNTEEYLSFQRDYPHIPVYYLPRPTDCDRVSTTNIIARIKKMASEEKITWDDLLPLHLTTVTQALPRSHSVTAQYEKDKKSTKHIDYMIWLKQMLVTYDYVLADNSYPYNVSDDISHKVFWFRGKISLDEAYEICKNEIPDTEMIIICNDISRKSILDIDHYHVFIKF